MKKYPLPSILIVCALRGTLFLGAGLVLVQPCAGDSGGFYYTGTLATARIRHTATLLPNGKVLVAGGDNGNGRNITSAELYNPASGTWTATGSLTTARLNHTATLLPNGKVLVAGGDDGFSAELYDPASGTWTATGSSGAAHDGLLTATLLPNGKVLVADLANAELYDPASGTWSFTGNLATARFKHTVTLLPNGKVLVAGGATNTTVLTSAELYDPASGIWTATGSLATARADHTATLLPDGKVLVAGGDNGSVSFTSAELYDPASGIWTATGSLATARNYHTETLLPNGKVLVAGGSNFAGSVTSAELYDPVSGIWTATGSMRAARADHTATLLPDGKVLVAGGFNSASGYIARAELFDPAAMPPVITSANNTMFTVGSNGSFTVATTGFPTPTLSESGALPSGVTFNTATGVLSGTPAAGTGGVYPITFTASNGVPPNAMQSFTLTVNQAPALTSANNTTFTVGSNGSFTVTTTGIPTPTLSESGALPSGVTFNTAMGVLSGTPAAGTGGVYPITFTASNGVPPDVMQSFTLTVSTVNQAPAITSANNTTFTVGSNGSFTVTTTGIPTPTLSESGALPSGVTFNTATGVLSGTPAAGTGGVYPITFTASNGVPPDAMQSFTLMVSTVNQAPVITSPLVASGTFGLPFVYQFEASGAASFAVSNLPPNLAFNNTLRAIVGTPSATGTFQVGLTASNTAGTMTRTLTLTVQPTPTSGPVIISSSAATGRVGQPFLFKVYTTGGTPAARLSTSALPQGLVLDAVSGVTGLISGTPLAEGSSAVILTVTDGPFTTRSTLQLTFSADPALPVIISPSLATLTPGQFFSYAITTDAPGPTSFTLISTLPAGLTLDPVTGIISGIYNPLSPESVKGGGSRKREIAGGALLGSIQLFGTNSHGTSTIPLYFVGPPSGIANISTRLLVGTGDNLLVGGFIIRGTNPKIVIVRALGPSINIPGALQDPVLELHDPAHPQIVVVNDNWRDSQQDVISATTIPPTNPLESAIVVGLDPGSYTAQVRGNQNGSTGIALVEAYDLGPGGLDISDDAKLKNISTRGFVDTGDNVMIGGFIISGQATRVIVRAIGPSLSAFGVPGALQDTTLELHNASGSMIVSNDDWRSDQEAEIIATTIPPTDDRESAIVANLVTGAYTAIVRGKNNSTGVALVEVYALQ